MTKTQLTAYEAVMAYIANRHEGVHMDVVAKMYDVNSGRVAEAVIAIEYTVNNIKEVYHMAQKAKGEVWPLAASTSTSTAREYNT